MQAPDPVEVVLARLMPPALRQDCQNELEAMIDELAGPEVIPDNASKGWLVRCVIGGGIAAAIGALCAVLPIMQDRPDAMAEISTGSRLIFISESDRIESMADEGWREDADGTARHALRLNAVEENSLLDEESGMVVLISQPREELLLMPINAF